MKINRYYSKGFTLIELLVVIAIIMVLGAAMFAIGTQMIRKSKATLMASNMKQMSSFFTAYATDNQQKLLPCRGEIIQGDGSIDGEALWHEIICSMLFETTDPIDFRDDDWWESRELFLRNPLFQKGETPREWSALNPGYGYNLMLAENYELAQNGSAPADALLELTLVPMAFIDDPSRTPIIAPADNYYYRYDPDQIDEWNSATLRLFLTDGNFPVLFMDGHIENVKPAQYVDRRFHEMPLDPNAP